MDIMKIEQLRSLEVGNQTEINLFLEAAYDVTKILNEAFSDNQLPINIKTKKVISGSEVREETYNYISPWFYRSIENWQIKYNNLNSVKNYLTYMLQNRIIDPPKFSDNDGKTLHLSLAKIVESPDFVFDEIIVFPIIDIVVSKLSIEFSESELIDSYMKYIRNKKSELVSECFNTPVIGFESELEKFVFSDDFTIEKFSDRHKNAYSKLTDFINGYSITELRSSTHMIRWHRQVSRSNVLKFDHERHLYLLVMSIRISSSSDIVAKFSYHEPNDCISIFGGGGKWHFETSKPWQFYDSHKFDENDLMKAKAVYLNLLRLESVTGYSNIFNVVVKRYLSSLSRTSPEDSLIDLTICLESLLLANERDELKFRLSLRGAIILQGCDPAESKKTLSNMYDDRSAIVHSGKTLLELRKDASSYIKKYREITEKVILAYLDNSKDFESIVKVNERLDKVCLYAGKLNE